MIVTNTSHQLPQIAKVIERVKRFKHWTRFGLPAAYERWQRHQPLRGYSEYKKAFVNRTEFLNYLGWVGHRNIGDEAMFEIFRDVLFTEELLIPYDDFSPLKAYVEQTKKKWTVLGGGTLINVLPYLAPLEAAKKQGEAYFVFGTGVADLNYWAQYPEHLGRGQADRWLEVLKGAEYLGVRGPRSAQWLKDHGIAHVEVLGDPALSAPQMQRTSSTDRKILGINLGSHDPVSGDGENLFQATVALVNYALSRGHRVHFFSLHPIDAAIGNRLKAALKNQALEVLPTPQDMRTCLQQIKNCDYVIGQRLHATILSCSQGIPNISLSYQPKCLDFLESIHEEELALPVEAISIEALIERFDWLCLHAQSIALRLNASTDCFRQLQTERAQTVLAALHAKADR